MKALDIQHGGNHYKDLKIQPVEYAQANQLPFCEGCVVKYCTRWQDKGGIQDLFKARHFIQFIREGTAFQQMLKRIRGACLAGAWWRDDITAETYAEANQLQREERCVINAITNWSNTGDLTFLREAEAWMEELLARALGEATESHLRKFLAHCAESDIDMEQAETVLKGVLLSHLGEADDLVKKIEAMMQKPEHHTGGA